MKTYFVSTQPGHFKVYCTPEDSFWCCTGTGMENPARYTRNIYYVEQDQLYVNLFIASQLEIANGDIKVIQNTSFPESDETTLRFERSNGEMLTVRIRVPYWVHGSATAVVNGQDVYTRGDSGYLTIRRRWKEGDCIEVKLPMNLHLYRSMDDPNKGVVMYGPVVLAGALGTENFPETDMVADHQELNDHPSIDVPVLVTREKDIHRWVRRAEQSTIRFQTGAIGQPGNVRITLVPFYTLHHQRYTLYWDIV